MYRTVAQLDWEMASLAAFAPEVCTRFELPEASVEGRTIHAMRLRAGDSENRRGVLLVGGTHARELMNPDLLVELAVDLIVSYLTGIDIVLGRRRWPARDVALMLEALDIYLLPCSNPDGRNYVMTVEWDWRKNRRVDPETSCIGVDINRNMDVLWGVTEGQTSCNPCSNNYVGPSALSEPESRNVKHLLDSHRIVTFADVHSYSELVLYPWSHAPTQTTDSSQRFTSLPSGTCLPIADPNYQEYMPARDLERFQTVSTRIVDAIADVRGRHYTPQAGFELYATTGTNRDYAYSRHVSDPDADKVYGFGFETGPWAGSAKESFQPADPAPIKREAESGLLGLISDSICGIELIGSRLLEGDEEVVALRRVRDELLATTAAGRDWIALGERVQTSLMGRVLADKGLTAQAATLLRATTKVVTNDGAALDRDTIAQAQALLRNLFDRAPSVETRNDLRSMQTVVKRSQGQTAAQVLRALMANSPDALHK
jgi:murein tripeptide amidase MpaA